MVFGKHFDTTFLLKVVGGAFSRVVMLHSNQMKLLYCMFNMHDYVLNIQKIRKQVSWFIAKYDNFFFSETASS